MTSVLLRPKVDAPVEMTTDPGFVKRVNRLVAISATALGLIFFLAVATTDAGWMAYGLLLTGWVSMPTLLARSVTRPAWRYLLTIPASLTTVGVMIVALGYDGSVLATLGWWSIAAGLGVGGTLGAWFWYRWMPVPRIFDRPFSAGRWALIATHAGLVLLGVGLVFFAEVL